MTLHKLWNASKPLTFTGLLMLVTFALCSIGLLVDSRIISGVPAWLKPAKFAISTALYTLTLAWVFTHLDRRTRLASVLGWIISLVLIIEIAIIDLQAFRGTTSHFNVATRFDETLYSVMGVSIGILWSASIAVAYLLFRQPFRDRSLGWALRLGMLISILGASLGGMMTRPTHEQLEAARSGHVGLMGSHSVGGEDGGPGIPAVRWSAEHGDLRVPHFFGLHALQLLPLIALMAARLRRLNTESRRTAFVLAAAGQYLLLLAILTWQALRGLPVISTDATISSALLAWAAAAGGSLAVILYMPAQNSVTVRSFGGTL